MLALSGGRGHHVSPQNFSLVPGGTVTARTALLFGGWPWSVRMMTGLRDSGVPLCPVTWAQRRNEGTSPGTPCGAVVGAPQRAVSVREARGHRWVEEPTTPRGRRCGGARPLQGQEDRARAAELPPVLRVPVPQAKGQDLSPEPQWGPRLVSGASLLHQEGLFPVFLPLAFERKPAGEHTQSSKIRECVSPHKRRRPHAAPSLTTGTHRSCA